MAKSVLIPLQVAAKQLDTLNKSFISSADVENGQIFAKSTLSTTADESEVYTITTPATATLSGLYMAWSPEDVILTAADGNQYKVGDMNPQNFTNVAGLVFSGFKPQVGDRILISADGFTGAKGVSDTHAVGTDGQDKLVWGTAAGNGLSFALEAVSYISIATGFGSQRKVAYIMECVKN